MIGIRAIGLRRSTAKASLRYKDMKLIGATFEKADKLAGILSGI